MFGKLKAPIDRTPHLPSPDSRPLDANESPGVYVFAVDSNEVVYVVPNGQHLHPKILGLARSALYAGEIDIDSIGSVDEVNNLSGTFQFRSRKSLKCVASKLVELGFAVGRVVWYPPDGLTAPRRLKFP